MWSLICWIVLPVGQQIVAMVFLFAGVTKLLHPSAAILSLDAYGVLPKRIAAFAGILLPCLEVTIGASLLTNPASSWAAIGAIGLLATFSFAQAVILLRGREVPCGCFGSASSRPVRWSSILRNVALSTLCVLGSDALREFVVLSVLRDSVSVSTRSVSMAEHVELRLIAGILFLHFLVFEQLSDNRSHEMTYEQYLGDQAVAAAIQRVSTTPLRP